MTPETIDTLKEFLKTGKYNGGIAEGSYCYLLVFEQDGKETFHPRFHQPCYGEMRIYRKGGWKPGDLHHPFPDGKPLGVAIRTIRNVTPAWEYTFSDDSLWAPVFKNRIIHVRPDSPKTTNGFLMTDMDFNSDYWFSLLLSLRMIPGTEPRYLSFVEKGVDKHTAWVAAMLTSSYGKGQPLNLATSYAYSLATPYSIKNLLNRTPLDFHEGKFFSDRATFRDRPDTWTSRIWGGKDNLFNLHKASKGVSLDEFVKEYIPYIESFR